MIYLDNAATTFPKPSCVYACVDEVQRTMAVNAGRGGYRLARHATDCMDATRQAMAQLVGADADQAVVFTPSATLAMNQILFGLPWDAYKVVYISPFEHNAVARPLEYLRKLHDFEVHILPHNAIDQTLDLEQIVGLFAENPPDYVILNHVSNVTGYILPIAAVTRLAKAYDAVVIVDGAQSLGVIPVDLHTLPLDFLVFAGHKNLYATLGVGGFICNSQVALQPMLAGGNGMDSLNLNMPTGMAGFELASPNIAAIASLQCGLSWIAQTEIAHIFAHKQALLRQLKRGLATNPKVTLYCPPEDMHTSVLSFGVAGYEAEQVGMLLDYEHEIAVRTGYHCAPYVHDVIGSRRQQGTVRVGLGYFNTAEDITALVQAIANL